MTPEALLKAYGTGQRDFQNSDLSGQNLDGEVLSRIDFRNANLTEASFVRANLYGANLQNADLVRAKLCGSSLKNANLTQTNLQKANLQFTDFSRANLAGANFTDADLRGADLSTAQLEDEDPQQGAADFTGAAYDQFTLFPKGIDPITLGLSKTVDAAPNSSSSTRPQPIKPKKLSLDSSQPDQSGDLNQLKHLYEESQTKKQQLEAELKQLKISAQNYLNRQASASLEVEHQIGERLKFEQALESKELQLQTLQQELDQLKQRKDNFYPAFPWVLTLFFLFYCYLGFRWSSRLPQPIDLNNINYTFLIPEISLFLATWAGFLLSNSKKSVLGYVSLLAAIATASLPIVINYSKLFLSATNFFPIVFFATFIFVIDIVIFVVTRRQRWGRSISQFNFTRTVLLLSLFGFSVGALVYFYRRIF